MKLPALSLILAMVGLLCNGPELANALDCTKNFSPCTCSTDNVTDTTRTFVSCVNQPIATIQQVFNTQKPGEIYGINLRFNTSAQAELPADLLNGTIIGALSIHCLNPSVQPLINATAFNWGTRGTNLYYKMELFGCDMIRQTDFNFLNGFAGGGFTMADDKNLQGFKGALRMPNVIELQIYRTSGLVDFPTLPPNRLLWLTIRDSGINDAAMSTILNKVKSFDGSHLQGLWLGGNRLTKVPEQTYSFFWLLEYELSNNQLQFINNQLKTYRNIINVWIQNSKIVYISPGAFDAVTLATVHMYLGNYDPNAPNANKLYTFEQNVFETLLKNMVGGGGHLDLNGQNYFECGCDILWLVETNLLGKIYAGKCSNNGPYPTTKGKWFNNLKITDFATMNC